MSKIAKSGGYLIIRLKGLGDIVHLIPSLQMIRKQNPNLPLGLLCQHPFGTILPPNLNIKIFHIKSHANIYETFKLLKKIRKQKYSKVFDLFGNPRTAIISLLSGIKERYGFTYRIRKTAYTKTYSPPDPNLHLMQLFNDFFNYFNVNGKVTEPALYLSKQEINKANEILLKNNIKPGLLLGINPHTTYPSKAWPAEYFIQFINLWYGKTKRKALITWGPGEFEKTRFIIEKSGKEKLFAHPELTIREFAALLSKLNLFLTGDTGPMNIAWAVKTPTVTLFGPTTRKAVEPKGKLHLTLFNKNADCLQCHKEVCDDMRCMNEMSPEWVFNEINKKYKVTNE